jgi:predicted RNase H-like HicB family nuclease
VIVNSRRTSLREYASAGKLLATREIVAWLPNGRSPEDRHLALTFIPLKPSATGNESFRRAWPEPGGPSADFRTPCAESYRGLVTRTYTGTYTRIPSGYMGQLVDWPEVVTEGKTLEQCRELLEDTLHEMIAAYRQQGKELPAGRALLEQIPVEV